MCAEVKKLNKVENTKNKFDQTTLKLINMINILANLLRTITGIRTKGFDLNNILINFLINKSYGHNYRNSLNFGTGKFFPVFVFLMIFGGGQILGNYIENDFANRSDLKYLFVNSPYFSEGDKERIAIGWLDCPTPVTVDAGPDISVCISGEVTLGGYIAGPVVTGQWIGGLGNFFPDRFALDATYTPDISEVNTTVVLTLLSDDPEGDCTAVSDDVSIIVNELFQVDAGPDISVCIDGEVTLSGLIISGGSSIEWVGGTGIFTPDRFDLNASYTPDITEAGTEVNLTLVPSNPLNVCPVETDDITLTIDAAHVVDAGEDQIICSNGSIALNGNVSGGATSGHWYGGIGDFNPDRDALNAIYTPDISESGTTVTLTLESINPFNICPPANDEIDIIVNPPTFVDAGPDISACIDGEIVLSGIISGGATTGTWSGGAGSFDDVYLLNATYTPHPSEAGTTIILMLTSDGTDACPSISDNLNIEIDETIIVDAGPDITTCVDGTVGLGGFVYPFITPVLWTGGLGTFNDATLINAEYTPDPSEAGTTVILTLLMIRLIFVLEVLMRLQFL